MPRLLCLGRPWRIAAALKDHPLRTPMRCREYATPALPLTTVTHSGRAEGPPRAHPLFIVSTICHVCFAQDYRDG
eukprot:8410130-Pyramimonas_sp.AAC.1